MRREAVLVHGSERPLPGSFVMPAYGLDGSEAAERPSLVGSCLSAMQVERQKADGVGCVTGRSYQCALKSRSAAAGRLGDARNIIQVFARHACLCASGRAGSGCERGNRAVKVVPSISEDVTLMVPPCATTTCLAM